MPENERGPEGSWLSPVVQALRAGGDMSVAQIGEETGLPTKSVHERIDVLHKDGYVLRVQPGVYRLMGQKVDGLAAPLPAYRKALVVGGEESLTKRQIVPNLAAVGIRVLWVWPYKRNEDHGKPIPEGCELVIILTSLVSHSRHDTAVREAKRRGIPFVRATHKWSVLLQQLIAQRVIAGKDMPAMASAFLLPSAGPAEPEWAPEPEPEPPKWTPPAVVPVRPERAAGSDWSADGKDRAELLRVFRECVAELITGHGAYNIQINDLGKITMDIKTKIDLG